MVPQKIHEHLFFSKPKVKKGKNVLVYNFYLILKFHKKRLVEIIENGQNCIRKICNLVLVYLSKQGYQ